MRRVREAIRQSAVAATESRQDASNIGQRRGSTSATPQELSSLQQTRVGLCIVFVPHDQSLQTMHDACRHDWYVMLAVYRAGLSASRRDGRLQHSAHLTVTDDR